MVANGSVAQAVAGVLRFACDCVNPNAGVAALGYYSLASTGIASLEDACRRCGCTIEDAQAELAKLEELVPAVEATRKATIEEAAGIVSQLGYNPYEAHEIATALAEEGVLATGRELMALWQVVSMLTRRPGAILPSLRALLNRKL